MRTIFFDIDGTLIQTGGAGLKAMSQVMRTQFGVDKLPQVPVHGRTDFGIWRDVFLGLGLEPPNDFGLLIEEYCNHLAAALDGGETKELPGVRELLDQLAQREDVSCCLLTGNARRAARIKLETFGLEESFLMSGSEFVGGFGDATDCRNHVAQQAVDSVRSQCSTFDVNRAWVIGDTVRDIDCARSIGAQVMAVETGGDSMESLLAGQPDLVVKDLSKVDEILQVLFA